ncbi:hypothetical protein ACFL0W_02680 [Nanoarchaeota archaeon]
MNQEKKNTIKKIALPLVLIILILAIIPFIKLMGKTGLLIQRGEMTNFGHLTPSGIDFPSDADGGTLAGWAGEAYFKEVIDNPVILFASANIPGLTMIYYPYEERLVAGTPQMVVEGIKLFKGEKHKLAYSFDKNGKQRIFLDDKLMAESDFKVQENELVGMITGAPELIISDAWETLEFS